MASANLRAKLEFSSRVRLGTPKPYNSRHLKPSERFQNSSPRYWFRRGPLRAGHGIPNSTIHTRMITNQNLEICFHIRFRMERRINSPRFSFTFVFAMIMLGTHKPQQEATLTKSIKIPEIFFRFRSRNAIERKS